MNVLLYDGSFTGLICAIYDAFYSKVVINGIYEKTSFQGDMLTTVIYVTNDDVKFKKVENAIIEQIDKNAYKKVYMVYLSNYENKEMIVLKYLKEGFKLGKHLHNFLHYDIVREVDLINRRVSLESHRFKGFVRFNYINNEFLYASINPDNNILELMGNHFKKRFSNENWIIHDINRDLAIIYNKHSWELIPFDKENYDKLNTGKDAYAELWKEYFKSTNIKERENPRLQKRMMPKRYWHHLTEID